MEARERLELMKWQAMLWALFLTAFIFDNCLDNLI